MRHSQSTWNSEHRIQGQLDPPLSDEGRRQAARLGRRFAGRRPAGFYTSDLKRAAETAHAIAVTIGAEPRAEPGLREIHLGEWEGMRTQELAQRYPEAWKRWSEEPDWDLVPGGEGAATFDARIGEALEAIYRRHQEGDVVVVTHGGVIQVALHRVIGLASRGIFPFKIQNASITVIERRDGRLIIGGVNDVAHLEPSTVAEPSRG